MNPASLRKRAATAALLLACAAPAAAQELPYLNAWAEAAVPEGDSGLKAVTVNWNLQSAQATPVSFTYEVPADDTLADSPADFVAVAPTVVTIAPGQTSGSFEVHIVGDLFVETNSDDYLRVYISDVVGAQLNGGDVNEVSIRIDNDDQPIKTAWIQRDESVGVWENAHGREVSPLLNDTYAWEDMQDAVLTIVAAPVHGTVTVSGVGMTYVPAADFSGDDDIGYRICAGGDCRDGTTHMVVGPTMATVEVSGPGRSDSDTQGLWSLRALTAAEYLPTPLVAPTVHRLVLTPDFTPESPWDSADGVAYASVVLPALPAGESVEHRLRAFFNGIAAPGSFTEVDLYVGVDENGDGRPSAAEVRCTNGQIGNADCDMRFDVAAAPTRWWVMAHNRQQLFTEAEVIAYDVAMVDGDGSLMVTGPGTVERLAQFDLRMAWDDASLLPDERRRGYVRIKADADSEPMLMPVEIARSWSNTEVALPLRVGESRTLTLAADAAHDRLWFDVPSGATKLTVTSAGSGETDFYVVRQTAAIDARSTQIAAAPARALAAAAAEGAGGNETVVVQGGALAPGRWYVVPRNTGATTVATTLTLQLEALAPIMRSGSYFNAARPGSGLFLYPAGSEWTGLWYTYREGFGIEPGTWYYLQAAAPGADGVWHSAIWRGTWNGTTRTLTQVGTATVTPTGPDQFSFSYVLHGHAGSQPMAALGRGCPAHEGSALDISNQWFDPAKSGTGYSVQMWENYEYFAAFVYDFNGEPLFLAAERSGFGGAEATLDLQLLEGPCPTCTHQTGLPLRTNVGTFTRHVGTDALQRIEIDALYGDVMNSPNAFWTADDNVVPLGGPGTSQGCEP